MVSFTGFLVVVFYFLPFLFILFLLVHMPVRCNGRKNGPSPKLTTSVKEEMYDDATTRTARRARAGVLAEPNRALG